MCLGIIGSLRPGTWYFSALHMKQKFYICKPLKSWLSIHQTMNWEKTFESMWMHLVSILLYWPFFLHVFNRASLVKLVTQPDVLWTNSNAVPPWCAGAPSISRRQQWQTDSNFWRYNLLSTHPRLQFFSFCSFLVPLWLMCLSRYMLPLRQEQLTASFTMP